MSALSVSWSPAQVHLGCRPDPQKPAQPLGELLPLKNSPDAGSIAAVLDACIETENGRDRGKAEQRRAGRARALAEYFERLLASIDAQADSEIILMGPVERLILVLPPSAPAAATQRIETLAGAIPGVKTMAVNGSAAALASHPGLMRPGARFLMCHWGEDLSLYCAEPTRDLRSLERVSPVSRLRQIGWACIEALVAEALGANAGHVGSKDRTAVAMAFLRGDAFDVSTVEGQRVSVSRESVRLIRDRWKARVQGFLKLAARELSSPDLTAVVVSGALAEISPVADLLERTLRSNGLPVCHASFESQHTGAHELIPGEQPLPYDCGFVIRKPGSEAGTGTLVLIRPESIGTRRVSGVVEHPAQKGETLEVAVYLRRVDFQKRNISYELMRSRTFAADPGDLGMVRLKASMKVESDAGDSGDVTVSIEVEDLNSGARIPFTRLPLSAAKTMSRPPLHSQAELGGAGWARQFDERRGDLPANGQNLSVAQWLANFRGHPQASRASYAISIMLAAGFEVRSLLASPDFVASASPEEFQAAAREALYEAMHALGARHAGLGAMQSWRSLYPANAAAPKSAEAARALVNNLSTSGADQQALSTAQQLLRHYELACVAPRSLNIDW